MNEQVTKANEYASAFEAFITAHPVITCIALAWVVSWVLTITFRPVIRAIFPDNVERHFVRVFDVLIAGLVAFDMWPNDHALWWAAGIGGTSPVAYLALSDLLCWKWPGLRKHLSLREFAGDSESEDKPQDPTP